MPLFVLIDTCIWKKMVSKDEFSFRLRQLQRWIETKQIELVITEQIKEEWVKHRELESAAIRKAAKSKVSAIKAAGFILDITFDHHETIAQQRLEKQIYAIDELISSGLSIEHPDAVNYLTYQLKMSRKPPFHIKLDSDNDSNMLFDTMHYFSKNPQKEFYLLTSNTDEFSSTENKTIFNPTLNNHYPDVRINYYIDHHQFFNSHSALGLSDDEKSQEDTRRVRTTHIVDTAAPVLDQLYQYLSSVFKHWSFLPIKNFTEHFPFLKGENVNFHRTPFTLYTDNQEVYKLLTSIRINKERKYVLEGSEVIQDNEEHQKKLQVVTLTLAINLVHNIKFSDRSEIPFFSYNFNIPKEHFSDIKNFRFSKLFEKRKIVDDNSYERLKDAYAEFRLGNFLEMISICEEVSQMASCEHNPQYFIARFNIVKMKWFLHNYYYGEDNQQEVIKKIDLINLNEELAYYKNSQDYYYLELINKEQLIPQYAMRISAYRDTIRNSYHSKDRGFNEAASNMLFNFYELTNFITLNCVLIEDDAQFRRTATAFLEGVIASYASSSELGGKIVSFDDTLLIYLTQYCTSKEIRSNLQRYQVQKLAYKIKNSGSKSFIEIFLGFLQDYELVVLGYTSQSSIKTHFFWNNYDKYFENFLTLLSVLDLPIAQIEDIAVALLKNLRVNKHLTVFDANIGIKQFLGKQGNNISSKTLKDYFCFFALDDSFRDASITDEISDFLSDTSITLKESEFDQLKLIFFSESNLKNNLQNADLLRIIYRYLTDEKQKSQIKKFVINLLDRSFDETIYYKFSISGVIPHTQKMENIYINKLNEFVLSLNKNRPQLFGNFSINQVDNYLNYLFSKGLMPEEHIKDKLCGINLYYCWLLDIDNFDYKKFEIKWLSNHFTIFFKQHYCASEILRKFLLDYIRANPRSEVPGIYIRIFELD
jgi:hypothetical protein